MKDLTAGELIDVLARKPADMRIVVEIEFDTSQDEAPFFPIKWVADIDYESYGNRLAIGINGNAVLAALVKIGQIGRNENRGRQSVSLEEE